MSKQELAGWAGAVLLVFTLYELLTRFADEIAAAIAGMTP